MGRDDLCITVPSFFRCPISLDVMKSPVSLCTGVTYDRSSIQRWLDGGNNTCPATMQVLQTKDFVPNHNLQRLIRIWSDSALTRRPSDPTRTNPPPHITRDQARYLITEIQNPNPNPNLFDAITKLVSFAKDSDQNRKLLATTDRFLPVLVEILTNSISSIMIIGNSMNYIEELFVLLELVLREYRDRDSVTKSIVAKRDPVNSLMISVLKQGSLASRVAVARVLESIATDADQSKSFFAEQSECDDVVWELFRLMSTESDSVAIEAALSALICVAKLKRIRVRLVRLGCVKALEKLLCNPNSSAGVNERVLRLLETVSSCKEGRAEMCRDEACVSAVVRRMLKVSAAATESAVAVLWSLCYLFREEAAAEAVVRSNGLTKILLIMQSNCSPAAKQMAGDLLKVFRVNSKSCLSSYDTKTTHIMPF
ncbi:U-box domain-containing protein 28-like [Rhododendron vialii]|uniref:U-box domain-containing protein 28-like n=1 Tax=Rhododendron vialii TaxID=182163 RepID=UPI00265E91DB|nr:U-box domain-containing protein 28-like [Rhododendron vialii]